MHENWKQKEIISQESNSKGSIYVAEVAWTYWFSRQENPPVGEIPSLRKWKKND